VADGQKIRWTATPANRMSDAEVARFLAEPRVACLATNRADGFPHLSPIWFVFDDGVAFFALAQSRIHLANLRRDRRAALMVEQDERPELGWHAAVRGVVLRGRVELIDDERGVAEYGDRIDRRYLSSSLDDPSFAEVTEPERYTLVRLAPSARVSWDFRHGRP
jgi:PPOX class probable F420-dependent enzyme